VGVRPGTGRRQLAILAALDGLPREFRELASEVTGHEPTKSELASLQRAAHDLAGLGLLQRTRVPRGAGGGSGAPRVYLVKVSRRVSDFDGAAGTEGESPPVFSPGWLRQAWAAFGSDPGYLEAIAAAARGLMTLAEQEQLLGARLIGDDDGAIAAEVRRARLEVQDVGVKAD